MISSADICDLCCDCMPGATHVSREAIRIVRISEIVWRPHFQKSQREARESKTLTLSLWRAFQFIRT